MSPTHQAVFERAASRWQSIIIADLSTDLVVAAGSSHCGHTFANRTVIDDLGVAVRIMNIDGPGNVIARAGICVVTGTGKTTKPRIGLIEVDIGDIDRMTFQGNFEGIVMHEMGESTPQAVCSAEYDHN